MEKKVEKNRIVMIEQGREIGEITFHDIDKDFVDIDHTYVDPVYRGKHIASLLMEELVSHLEDCHVNFVASCSFAKSWLEKQKDK